MRFVVYVTATNPTPDLEGCVRHHVVEAKGPKKAIRKVQQIMLAEVNCLELSPEDQERFLAQATYHVIEEAVLAGRTPEQHWLRHRD